MMTAHRLSLMGQAARVAAGVTLAVALAAPLPLPAMAQGAAAVNMTEDAPDHYAFTPGGLTVATGTTVTWTDKSDAPHTVTSDTGMFGSSQLSENQTFRFTFSQAGTYNYHCMVHSYMHGTITVTAGASTAANVASASTTGNTASASRTPAQMPNTGAGGMAAPSGAIAALLGGLGALLAALRRRR